MSTRASIFVSKTLAVFLLLAAVSALPALVAAPAFAQEDPRVAAAAHFKRGLEHAKQNAFAEALAEFEAAYGLVQHDATLYNIALAQIGLGRRAEAVLTLQRYLASPPEPKSAEKRKAASAQLDQLLAELARAEDTRGEPAQAPATAFMPTTAQLTIVVFPYGQVWIDGQPAGSSPVVKTVASGLHRITGGREGPEKSADVVIEPGTAKRVVLPWARAELVPSSDVQPSAARPNVPITSEPPR